MYSYSPECIGVIFQFSTRGRLKATECTMQGGVFRESLVCCNLTWVSKGDGVCVYFLFFLEKEQYEDDYLQREYLQSFAKKKLLEYTKMTT